MAHASEPGFLVLHTVRLKGFAEADAVAAASGLPNDDVVTHLQSFADRGLALRREGQLSGWSLTAAGRAQHGEQAAAEVAASGARADVERAYRAFLGVNGDLLGVCTDWQLKPSGGAHVPNDHADPAYDKEVVVRLRDIDDRVQPVCRDLAAVLARFGRYGHRLDHAVSRVEAGEPEWFTKPLIDSYHTVWFELHEDLLATLGIERSKESA